jgi:hypothetical protein
VGRSRRFSTRRSGSRRERPLADGRRDRTRGALYRTSRQTRTEDGATSNVSAETREDGTFNFRRSTLLAFRLLHHRAGDRHPSGSPQPAQPRPLPDDDRVGNRRLEAVRERDLGPHGVRAATERGHGQEVALLLIAGSYSRTLTCGRSCKSASTPDFTCVDGPKRVTPDGAAPPAAQAGAPTARTVRGGVEAPPTSQCLWPRGRVGLHLRQGSGGQVSGGRTRALHQLNRAGD